MNTKRIVSALLAGIMAISSSAILSSCSKKSSEPVKEKRTNVYTEKSDMGIPAGLRYVNRSFCDGDNIYVQYNKEYTVTYNDVGEEVERKEGYTWGDSEEEEQLPEGWWTSYDSEDILATKSLEGGEWVEISVTVPDEIGDGYISAIGAGGSKIYVVISTWIYNEDYTESTCEYSMVKYDASTGEQLGSFAMNDVFTKAGIDTSNVYVNNIDVSSEGNIVLALDAGVFICGPDGEYIGYAETGSDNWLNDIFCDGSDVYCTMYDSMNGGYSLTKYEDGMLNPVGSDNFRTAINNVYNFLGVYDGKLYYSGTYGVYVYDIEADTSSEVLNYINSDINPNEAPALALLADGDFLGIFTEYDEDWNSTTTIKTLTKVPDSELQEEIIIRISSVYSQYYLTKSVISYNKQNNGIRITMSDYSSYNNADNEWTGAATQFNNDIITGNVADIVVLSVELPVESYTHKGIFEDLTPYIEGENGLDTSDYMTNILDATKVDGKQYSIIASYYINTLTAKNKFVGDAEGMTFEDMMQIISSLPEGTEAFFGCSRETIIDNFFTYALSSLVDWDTGETKFDSEGFIEFIEYLSTCSEKGYWDDYYGEDYEYDADVETEMNTTYEMRFYKDRGVFNFQLLSSFSDLMYARNTFGTDDFTTIGYPTEDGSNGSVIYPEIEFAMSSKSQAKEQAWSVIKYFISGNLSTYSFGLLRSELNEKLEEAGESWSTYEYTEEDRENYRSWGYSEEYIDYLFASNAEYDQKFAEKTMSLIENANIVQRTDSDLVEIIKEELSGYFGGSKTAEETAKVIASRAGIYISENS